MTVLRLPSIATAALVAACGLAGLGLAGCGSDGPPATAKEGDKFCRLAEKARDAGDEVDVSSTDPDQLKEQIDAAIAASKAAAEKAPKDFADIADANLAQQEAVVALLEDYDYSFIDAVTSEEGRALFGSDEYTQNQEDRDEYLQEKCALEPTDDTSGAPPLASGDEGIRQLFQLLEVGAGVDITDEQIECAVDALSGKISDDDLRNIATNADVSEEVQSLVGTAIIGCGIDFETD